MPKWLSDAAFYEIYPQSFMDTNEDGIGDLNGIIEKLDYIKDLGCNALWINPCFDSPFKDAGYDVRDYKKIAPRYGNNSDMYRLFGEAHKRDMHVLLDLVPGHTSEEHPWFLASKKAEENEYSDRYVWTKEAFKRTGDHPCVSGESDRNGSYMLNFFKCQPALNYGFLNPTEDWQMSPDSPACKATLEAMKDVIRFWLDHGADGFRVDMADSLIKDDDEDKSGTCALWRNVREMLDKDYPEAAFVSEWSNPAQSLKAGFHMDFYLDHHGNGYNSLFRDNENEQTEDDNSFFKRDANGDIMRFLNDYLPKYHSTCHDGYISFITCNHDTPRAKRTMSDRELKIAYAFIYSMPGVPFMYYGDEIGMRYLDIPTKEGGYGRTGSRTPMQWDNSANYGFSKAPEDTLYLPVDKKPGAPTLENQQSDPDSLYSNVKRIIALRHEQKDLQADGEFEVIFAEKEKYPFVFRRGNLIVAVNPSNTKCQAHVHNIAKVERKALYKIGDYLIAGSHIEMAPQSFVILQ